MIFFSGFRKRVENFWPAIAPEQISVLLLGVTKEVRDHDFSAPLVRIEKT